MSEPVIDAGRASGEPFRPQHLVIDFTPQRDDSDETGHKCTRFWDAVRSHPDLEGLMALPDQEMMKESSAVPVHRASPPPLAKSAFPAVQAVRNLADTGVIEAAFAATSSKVKH